jgi:hypothetical protein
LVLLVSYGQMISFAPDTITYGILDTARQWSEGKGFTSNAIPVAFLPYYREHTLPLPYLWYPLLPLFTGILFKVFGPEPRLVLVLPLAAYFTSGLLLAEIGRRLFNTKIGVLAAMALMSHPFMLETGLRENFTDTILVALILGCVLCIVAASGGPAEREDWRLLVIAGVLLGLSQYARSAAMALYLPVGTLVWVLHRHRLWRAIATVLISALITQLPLSAYYYGAIGRFTFTPTYILLFLSDAFPGLASFTVLVPPERATVMTSYGGVIFKKWLSQIWVHYKYFFTFMSPLLLVSALLSPTVVTSNTQRGVGAFAIVFLAVLIPFNSLIYWDNRYLLPIVPFVALFGIAGLQFYLSHATTNVRRAMVAVCVVLVAIEPLDFFYQVWKSRMQYPRLVATLDERAATLRTIIRPDDVVMAADPGFVGWEIKVPAVTLARDPDTALRVRQQYFPFNVLLLDERRPRADMFGYAADWYDIAAGTKTFPGFQRAAAVTVQGQTIVVLRSLPSDKSR